MCLSGDPIDVGTYSIDLQFKDPHGAALIDTPFHQVLTAERRAPLAAIFQIGLFPLNGVGKYELELSVNGQLDLAGAFTVTQGPAPAIR